MKTIDEFIDKYCALYKPNGNDYADEAGFRDALGDYEYERDEAKAELEKLMAAERLDELKKISGEENVNGFVLHNAWINSDLLANRIAELKSETHDQIPAQDLDLTIPESTGGD